MECVNTTSRNVTTSLSFHPQIMHFLSHETRRGLRFMTAWWHLSELCNWMRMVPGYCMVTLRQLCDSSEWIFRRKPQVISGTYDQGSNGTIMSLTRRKSIFMRIPKCQSYCRGSNQFSICEICTSMLMENQPPIFKKCLKDHFQSWEKVHNNCTMKHWRIDVDQSKSNDKSDQELPRTSTKI